MTTAIIEKGTDGGYCVYAQDPNMVIFGNGFSEAEAKEDFEIAYQEVAEFMKEENGKYPSWYNAEETFEYLYDMSGFFLAFPFINVTEFAKYVGVNSSLMRRYKSGLAKAGAKQKDLIQSKFDSLLDKFNAVRFV